MPKSAPLPLSSRADPPAAILAAMRADAQVARYTGEAAAAAEDAHVFLNGTRKAADRLAVPANYRAYPAMTYLDEAAAAEYADATTDAAGRAIRAAELAEGAWKRLAAAGRDPEAMAFASSVEAMKATIDESKKGAREAAAAANAAHLSAKKAAQALETAAGILARRRGRPAKHGEALRN